MKKDKVTHSQKNRKEKNMKSIKCIRCGYDEAIITFEDEAKREQCPQCGRNYSEQVFRNRLKRNRKEVLIMESYPCPEFCDCK